MQEMQKKSVYIETTIPSFVTAKPTTDIGNLFRQTTAKTDCSHLAICVVNKIDFLLSWNMTHLGDVAHDKVLEYNIKRNLWVPSLLDPDTFMRKMQLEETADV